MMLLNVQYYITNQIDNLLYHNINIHKFKKELEILIGY